MWLKISLIIFIVNNSIPTTKEAIVFENTLKQYASYVGVELAVTRRNIKDRMCERRYSTWEQSLEYYYCMKRYTRQKKGQFNMFVKSAYVTYEGAIRWERGGGRGALCVKKHGGISFIVFRSTDPLPSAVSASHELFHNLGATHQEIDPDEIMYPAFFSDRINAHGGMTVGSKTKAEIQDCNK